MKKIDKLVFGSFIGPFLLTLIVVDFILLLVTLLKYFDQIMGKGLSFGVFAELITYFSISSSPDAFPLAVLLSSIMTFGNLGEHSELTAVKSSGISLVRVLVPIFIFVVMLTGFTFYSNTQLVPRTNLKTYSLLWDMRTKKPALDIKEGVFYNGIPGYTIKANEKIGDEHLVDIIIYDHRNSKTTGNKVVILADSGRMYSSENQRYMILELYNGRTYREEIDQDYQSQKRGGQFSRESFKSSRIIFDLSSFDLNETDKRLFRRSRLVQTRRDLIMGVDSMSRDFLIQKERLFGLVAGTFNRHFIRTEVLIPQSLVVERAYYDSLRLLNQKVDFEALAALDKKDSVDSSKSSEIKTKVIDPKQELAKNRIKPVLLASKNFPVNSKTKLIDKSRIKKVVATWDEFDSHFERKRNMISALVKAQNDTRTTRNHLNNRIGTLESINNDRNKFIMTKNQQVARSFSCLIMFLIGAPIGAIIKKGGIGLPVVVSISFFLVFYILNSMGEKWGKQGMIDPTISVWISNAVLFPFGLFFLYKARNDAKLFEADFYLVWWGKIKNFFLRKKRLETT